MPSADSLSLGIDASNIRSGGGLTHLRELLCAVEPAASGITKVIVWSGDETLDVLPERSWLELVPVRNLKPRRVFQRMAWHRGGLEARAETAGCSALLIPGGSYLGRFKPFVAICQNLLPFCPSERVRFGLSWARLRYHALEHIQRTTFCSADGVVFLSKSARQIVLKRLRTRCINSRVIPHGVHERFRTEPRAQRPLSTYSPEKPFRWLYVSTINWYKHQETVAIAAARLRRGGWPVAVDFVGPAYPPALRSFERVLGLTDPAKSFLKYHGAVPMHELETWYRQADGCVFASSCENMPNILVEAMAAALPIVCSRVPPMPEILRRSGLYFAPEKPDELADLLLRFMTNPALRTECARRAFEGAFEYSWSKCAQETFDFVAACARGGLFR